MKDFMKLYQRQIVAGVLLTTFWCVASGVEAVGPTFGYTANIVNKSSTVLETVPSGSITTVIQPEYAPAIYSQTSVILPSFDGSKQLWQPLGWSAGEWRADLFSGSFSIIGRGEWSTPLEVNAVRYKTVDNLPWKLKLASEIFDFDINAEGNKAMLDATIRYIPDNDYKQAYVYDEIVKEWRALPSTDYPLEGVLRLVLKQFKGRIAVFSNPGILTVGRASWYAYKPGLFTASPDFPKGSKLRVINLDNGKSIEVIVNDWGPERDKHPDRVVDLSKEAFLELAPLSQGTMRVAISPIEISPDRNGKVLGVKDNGLSDKPKITAKSAIILNERNGEVILSKNSEQILPIASLSKVIAMSVYLREQSDLNKKITYSDKDAKFNGLYVNLADAAQINLKNGDQAKTKDFIYASVVASANNAVETLVRDSGLSREKFVEKMNLLAVEWGAKNTHFVEPTGLSSKNVSTAEDYAIITREAFKNDVLKKASVTPKYVFTVLNRKASKTLSNTNQLVLDQAQKNLKLAPLGINGSKTGFLKEAGYCLLTRVQNEAEQYTIITFGSPTRKSSFNEMMDLIKYANLKS